MRYFKAILSTILLVAIPLITLPFLKWYEKYFDVNITWIYVILGFISVGMCFLCVFSWIIAILDKETKDLFEN